MPDLWRISNHKNLTGDGGLRYAARWHSAGRPIVYLAESPAGALLEILVHLELDDDELPPTYTLLRITVPDDVTARDLAVPAEGWKSDIDLTRRTGDEWLRRGESALARVPSVLLPATSNVLLNPLHADAQRIIITDAIDTPFDPRLLRRVPSK